MTGLAYLLATTKEGQRQWRAISKSRQQHAGSAVSLYMLLYKPRAEFADSVLAAIRAVSKRGRSADHPLYSALWWLEKRLCGQTGGGCGA